MGYIFVRSSNDGVGEKVNPERYEFPVFPGVLLTGGQCPIMKQLVAPVFHVNSCCQLLVYCARIFMMASISKLTPLGNAATPTAARAG